MISAWSRIPKRVFSSPIGIETLAARIVASEALYVQQLVLDLRLGMLGHAVLALSDNKNVTEAPKENHLKLDYFSLNQMRDAEVLSLQHCAGKKNWTDCATKAVREVVTVLMHLACAWGGG